MFFGVSFKVQSSIKGKIWELMFRTLSMPPGGGEYWTSFHTPFSGAKSVCIQNSSLKEIWLRTSYFSSPFVWGGGKLLGVSGPFHEKNWSSYHRPNTRVRIQSEILLDKANGSGNGCAILCGVLPDTGTSWGPSWQPWMTRREITVYSPRKRRGRRWWGREGIIVPSLRAPWLGGGCRATPLGDFACLLLYRCVSLIGGSRNERLLGGQTTYVLK